MTSTLPKMWWPLMESGDVETPVCAVCGRGYPLNRHHMVPRSAGALYRDGREMPKPTIVLCGNGNNLRDANGVPLCHGLVHHHMLHFRFRDGKVEYMRTERPVDYLTALGLDGWKEIRYEDRTFRGTHDGV